MDIRNEIKSAVVEALDERKNLQDRNLVYGLKGLAALLGVSYSTAYRIKRSKVLSKATFQVNRCITFDADKVFAILCEANCRYDFRGHNIIR